MYLSSSTRSFVRKMKVSYALLYFINAVTASPIAIEQRQSEDLPLLRLPYGTWQATFYDPSTEV
jgi:hypothetical protein